MPVVQEGRLGEKEVPLRTAMNEVLRDNYVDDSQRAIDKWNRSVEKFGLPFRFRLPSKQFHRNIGIYAGSSFDLDGRLITREEWERNQWLPSEADGAYVASLMHPVHERGKIANWIAPPTKGINGQPFDYEYVRLGTLS